MLLTYLQKEVDYRLAKVLLLNLYNDGLLTLEEDEKIRILLVDFYNSLIGVLDGGTELEIKK